MSVVRPHPLRARADLELLVADPGAGVDRLLDGVRPREWIARPRQEQRRHRDARELGAVVAAVIDRLEHVLADPLRVLQELVAAEVRDRVHHRAALGRAIGVLGVVDELQRRRVQIARPGGEHAQDPAVP